MKKIYAFFEPRENKNNRVVIIPERLLLLENKSINEYQKEFEKQIELTLEKESFHIFSKNEVKKLYTKKMKYHHNKLEIWMTSEDLISLLGKISTTQIKYPTN